jgi:hypothetical protein
MLAKALVLQSQERVPVTGRARDGLAPPAFGGKYPLHQTAPR